MKTNPVKAAESDAAKKGDTEKKVGEKPDENHAKPMPNEPPAAASTDQAIVSKLFIAGPTVEELSRVEICGLIDNKKKHLCSATTKLYNDLAKFKIAVQEAFASSPTTFTKKTALDVRAKFAK